jgi:hypothetical protein
VACGSINPVKEGKSIRLKPTGDVGQTALDWTEFIGQQRFLTLRGHRGALTIHLTLANAIFLSSSGSA